jgi:hypothetical protein
MMSLCCHGSMPWRYTTMFVGSHGCCAQCVLCWPLALTLEEASHVRTTAHVLNADVVPFDVLRLLRTCGANVHEDWLSYSDDP